jgi:uncharacterized protein YcbK (DUF882 family)
MHRVVRFAAVFPRLFSGALTAGAAASLVAAPLGAEVPPLAPRLPVDASRKGRLTSVDVPVLATLVDTHGTARVPLDDLSPTATRFEALLADPVLGSTHPLDPALLDLIRSLARAHPMARIELVSGFRSPKLNEALRKKGHHVASHSQHSLGHALDFRVVPAGSDVPIDPVELAKEVRGLGWTGGLGTYVKPDDRFVHADFGPTRAWYGQ